MTCACCEQARTYIDAQEGHAVLQPIHLLLTCAGCVQARTYLDVQRGSIPSDALYIIHIGANDYLDTINHDYNRTASIEGVLNHTAAAMELLYDAGARW